MAVILKFPAHHALASMEADSFEPNLDASRIKSSAVRPASRARSVSKTVAPHSSGDAIALPPFADLRRRGTRGRRAFFPSWPKLDHRTE